MCYSIYCSYQSVFILQHAEQLKSFSVQAPYGKGLNTILDTSVHRAWQIDAVKVLVPSTHSDDFFTTRITSALVNLAMAHLGLPTDALAVEAHLYSLRHLYLYVSSACVHHFGPVCAPAPRRHSTSASLPLGPLATANAPSQGLLRN